MIDTVGLVKENDCKDLVIMILKPYPKVSGDLLAILYYRFIKGTRIMSASTKFERSQDDYGFDFTYSIQFQEVMQFQLSQFIQVVLNRTQQFLGQVHSIFLPGTIANKNG